jgi:hypothetical protein
VIADFERCSCQGASCNHPAAGRPKEDRWRGSATYAQGSYEPATPALELREHTLLGFGVHRAHARAYDVDLKLELAGVYSLRELSSRVAAIHGARRTVARMQ